MKTKKSPTIIIPKQQQRSRDGAYEECAGYNEAEECVEVYCEDILTVRPKGFLY